MMRYALAAFIAAAATAAFAQNERQVDCENQLSQNDMTYCAGLDFEKADRELNIVYNKAIQDAKELDAEFDFSPERKGAVEALQKAQRAWIDYRDGHCESVGFESRGGSMEPMLVSGCMAELTARRTAEIKALSGETPE